MPILLVGLNHRTTPVELREKLYINGDKLYAVLARLRHSSIVIKEDAVLSTCNRLEVYAVVSDIVAAERVIVDFLCEQFELEEADLRPNLYILQGRLAVRHLMRVSSGLDSMILGEAQILGQVGTALECAVSVSTTGTILHRLLEQSQHTGKRARTETAISQSTTSVSHAAGILIKNQFANPYIVIVGAGEMAAMAIQAVTDLGMNNVVVVNRTLAHAQQLANEYGVEAYEWSQLWEQLTQADVVIGATGAPHIILYQGDLQQVLEARKERPLMLVDISVPRNIDSAADELEHVTLYDIDDMQQVVDDSLSQRQACVPDVENIIAEEEDRYWTWLNERNVVPVIKDLRREMQTVIQAELDSALNKMPDLDEHSKEIVQRMANRIMNKMLHAPTNALRANAANGNGEDYATVVRDLFDLTSNTEEKRLHA